ncbi:ABC transporter permease [Fulvivirga ligni]|uniref:ABC transporter permease n=1 Tax=Fulvivirga ligni TaxID=2904246 RepID=UPI001F3F1527|nr:ABC transporter permease [Fulvivirga ligni]UII20144.1 ABC transporter permease [Fulvivirga ligni]
MKHQPQPPQWCVRFLEWFCPEQLSEAILGDLLEQFDEEVEEKGLKSARWRFVWNVLLFFRPGILFRNNFKLKIINTIMFSNYFKIAFRSIMKRKLYSFINAFGLSIAIAFCVLIYLYISHERSFDQFHENKDRLYRISETSYDLWNYEPGYQTSVYLQLGLGPVLLEEIPEIEKMTRFNGGGEAILKHGDKIFTERITYVDKDFFTMFSFPLVSGNINKLLDDKHDIILTPEVAEKYFQDENPLGKTLELDYDGKNEIFTVSGVISESPSNSSLEYGVLISQENRMWYDRNMTSWNSYSTPLFIQLREGADAAVLKGKFDAVIDKYMGEDLELDREEYNVPEDVVMVSYDAQNILDIHLDTKIHWANSSDPQYALILGGIALLIMIIACINYVALALTTSAARKKEVGVRKAIGAQKNQLVSQFTFESITLAFISMILGMLLMVLFLPYFNDFTNRNIELTSINWFELVGVVMLLTLFIGFLAGSYPSLFLSSFKTSHVLKGGFTSKLKASFTKPLVVLQFALSAFLMISSVIMYKQMEYVTTKDLGFDKEQVLVANMHMGYSVESNKMVERLRTALEAEPEVVSVAGTSTSFGHGWNMRGFTYEGHQKSAMLYTVDPNFISLLDIELVEGRNFDPNLASDSNAVIVNEALVKDLGWENPLSQYLNYNEDSASRGEQVVGVMKNFMNVSLRSDVRPMFISLKEGYLTTALVKVNTQDMPATIAKIEDRWREVVPGKPFDYTFMDQDLANQYGASQRWMKIMGLATGFAILISCLGLFGLSGINALNRTKEIGIRKVFGAEVLNIFILLNRQYIWLAIIAFGLAAPVAWYVMTNWLSDFHYAIDMGWELFGLSMLLGVLVALLTVSYHGVRSAFTNPADTLKYE